MDKRIYLCLAHMSGKEMGFIQEAFDTNWVVPLGPNVSGFEQDLEAFVGENKHVVVFPEPVPPAIPIINIRLSVYLKQNQYFCSC